MLITNLKEEDEHQLGSPESHTRINGRKRKTQGGAYAEFQSQVVFL
jgi:hypothetical protein